MLGDFSGILLWGLFDGGGVWGDGILTGLLETVGDLVGLLVECVVFDGKSSELLAFFLRESSGSFGFVP